MVRNVKSLLTLPSLPQYRQVERILSTRTSLKQDQHGVYGSTVSFDGTDIDEANMSVVVPFADGNARDGVGDVVEVLGIRTDRHRKNPIALFDHGKTVTLPIGLCEDKSGKYTVERDGDSRKAWARVFFYQGTCGQQDSFQDEAGIQIPGGQCQKDEHALFCEQLFHLLGQKIIRAGSFGYLVLDARPIREDAQSGKPKGLHLLSTELLELGPVVLPANGDAVRKTLSDGRVCGKNLSQVLVKSLTPYASAKPVMLGYTKAMKSEEPKKEEPKKETAMERLERKRKEARSDAMVRRHAQEGNTSVRGDEGSKEISPLTRTDIPAAKWTPGVGQKVGNTSNKPQPSAKKDCGCDDCKAGKGCPCKEKTMAESNLDEYEKKKDYTDDSAKESANIQTKPYPKDSRPKPPDTKSVKDIRAKYAKGKKKLKGKKSMETKTTKSGDKTMNTGTKGGMVRKVKAAPMDMPTDDSMPGMGAEMDMTDPVGGEVANPGMGADEKLGAQILRRIYQDQEDIMSDYDQLRSLLEEPAVDKFLEGHLTEAESALSEVEGLFVKLYPDYPPLGPAEGEMADETDLGDVEEVDEMDEDLDTAPVVEDDAVDIDEPSDGTPDEMADVGDEDEDDEEVSPEDVAEGMQTKGVKGATPNPTHATQPKTTKHPAPNPTHATQPGGSRQFKSLAQRSKDILRSKYGKKSHCEDEDKKEEKALEGESEVKAKDDKDDKEDKLKDDEKGIEGQAITKQMGEEELGNLSECAKFLEEMSNDPGLTEEMRKKAGGWMKTVGELAEVEENPEEAKEEATEDTIEPDSGLKGFPEDEIYMAGLCAKNLEQEQEIEGLKNQLTRLMKVLP